MAILECDKFYAKIWNTGNTHVVTVPINLFKGLGLKDGMEVIVHIRELNQEEQEKKMGVPNATEGE